MVGMIVMGVFALLVIAGIVVPIVVAIRLRRRGLSAPVQPQSPPAAWYPSERPGLLRWWDGTRETEYSAPQQTPTTQ